MESRVFKVILSKEISNEKVVSTRIKIQYMGEEKSVSCKAQELERGKMGRTGEEF